MKAFVIVDVQNDFLPGGALGVPGGDEIVPVINQLMAGFDTIVATQDWHPAGHGSFAVNHPGRKPFEQSTLAGLPQKLWPVHCVQQTGGALFAPGLDTRRVDRVFSKGLSPEIDSYSGFFDNGRRVATGLGPWLADRGVSELYVAGLATDYCVKFTVLDALAEGFRVKLCAYACRGVNLQPGDADVAVEEMLRAGAVILREGA